jgi:hypothetical protein
MDVAQVLSAFDSVNVISLRPGDVLLFRCHAKLTDKQRATASKVLNETFPDHDFMILDGGQDIAVLRPEPGWFGRMVAWAKDGA